MSNDECNYTNVITEIAPVGDTQLFIRYRGHGANPHKYYPISVLTENWSDALLMRWPLFWRAATRS